MHSNVMAILNTFRKGRPAAKGTFLGLTQKQWSLTMVLLLAHTLMNTLMAAYYGQRLLTSFFFS